MGVNNVGLTPFPVGVLTGGASAVPTPATPALAPTAAPATSSFTPASGTAAQAAQQALQGKTESLTQLVTSLQALGKDPTITTNAGSTFAKQLLEQVNAFQNKLATTLSNNVQLSTAEFQQQLNGGGAVALQFNSKLASTLQQDLQQLTDPNSNSTLAGEIPTVSDRTALAGLAKDFMANDPSWKQLLQDRSRLPPADFAREAANTMVAFHKKCMWHQSIWGIQAMTARAHAAAPQDDSQSDG